MEHRIDFRLFPSFCITFATCTSRRFVSACAPAVKRPSSPVGNTHQRGHVEFHLDKSRTLIRAQRRGGHRYDIVPTKSIMMTHVKTNTGFPPTQASEQPWFEDDMRYILPCRPFPSRAKGGHRPQRPCRIGVKPLPEAEKLRVAVS